MKSNSAAKKASTMMAERIAKERGCVFCRSEIALNWQNYDKFGDYLSPRGRILPAQFNGNCAKHQRALAKVIKQARHLGLIAFTTQG
jgi:small subunit ribosomal protein S18